MGDEFVASAKVDDEGAEMSTYLCRYLPVSRSSRLMMEERDTGWGLLLVLITPIARCASRACCLAPCELASDNSRSIRSCTRERGNKTTF